MRIYDNAKALSILFTKCKEGVANETPKHDLKAIKTAVK
jgi:hypothetical protein